MHRVTSLLESLHCMQAEELLKKHRSCPLMFQHLLSFPLCWCVSLYFFLFPLPRSQRQQFSRKSRFDLPWPSGGWLLELNDSQPGKYEERGMSLSPTLCPPGWLTCCLMDSALSSFSSEFPFSYTVCFSCQSILPPPVKSRGGDPAPAFLVCRA